MKGKNKMEKWLETKSIQELKDFVNMATNKSSFYNIFGIEIKKKDIKKAKEILHGKEKIN